MGSSTTLQNQTSTATPTPQETTLENQQIGYNNFMMPLAQQGYGNMANLSNSILTGGNLPGQFNGAYGINPAQSQSMVNQAMMSLPTQFQAMGALDSGTAVQASANAGANILNQNAQFNTQALQNLLNIGMGGQSQMQGQMQGNQSQLAGQLSGLRTNTGSGSQTAFANPFTQAFAGMQAAGSLAGGIGGMLGPGKLFGCWVAAELFGGWCVPETIYTRFYMAFCSPNWFSSLYKRHGYWFSKFIKDKPILKAILKPLFLIFSKIGKEKMYGNSSSR